MGPRSDDGRDRVRAARAARSHAATSSSTISSTLASIARWGCRGRTSSAALATSFRGIGSAWRSTTGCSAVVVAGGARSVPLAGCAVLLMRLAELRVGRTVRLVRVMLFVFSALHGRSVVWFAAALNSWPTNLSVLSVILLHLRYLRTGTGCTFPPQCCARVRRVVAYEQSFFSVAGWPLFVVLYAPELSGRTGAMRTYVRRNPRRRCGVRCASSRTGASTSPARIAMIPPRGACRPSAVPLVCGVEGYLPAWRASTSRRPAPVPVARQRSWPA